MTRCQDNETSWVDWSLAERHEDLVRFTRQVLAFRRTNPVLRREAFYTDRDIQWLDGRGRSPDWLDPGQKRLACLIRGQDGPDLLLVFNADSEPATFVLPELARAGGWTLVIDTAQPTMAERDSAEREATLVTAAQYALGAHASAILVAACPEP